MTVVFLLVHFLAGGMQIGAIGYDDIVTAVRRGIVNRLVFSHEQDRDARCEAAERGWGYLRCDGRR